MRRTYHDITEMVGGREYASLHFYKPSEAKYASVRDADGWVTLVEAPEYWHAALVDAGFVVANPPAILDTLEFVEVSRGTD